MLPAAERMTDPADGRSEPSEEGRSELDAALGAFKPRGDDADSSAVSERARSGMTWNPVTASTPDAPSSDEPSRPSFQFDLGGALARLGMATDAPASADGGPAPEPDAVPDTTPDTTPAAAASAADPLADEMADLGTTATADVEATGDVEALPVRARRGADPEPTIDPLPTRSPASAQPVAPAEDVAPVDAAASPVVDRLPTRSPRREPVPRPSPAVAPDPDPAPAPARSQAPARSVFAEANPAPTLPVAGAAPVRHVETSSPRVAPVPGGADLPNLPTLPASVPAAPPVVIAPTPSAPSTPELNALRAAQLRAQRNDRQGKMVGRALLALIAVAGLIAGSLVFGRSYLFPTEWDPELTPLVDEFEQALGVEFDHAVALSERPASEYGPLVTAALLGEDWAERLPAWRALGLAGGDGAVSDVQVRVAGLYPAFYDADADTIVVSVERSADGRAAALRLALAQVAASQSGADTAEAETAGNDTAGNDTAGTPALGLTGLESMSTVAQRAHDAAAVDLVASSPDAVADLAGVPLPIAYHLRAALRLGPALTGGGSDPRPGAELAPAVLERLADAASPAPPALLQPGDEQVGTPVSLGADDWALVWASRLSADAVEPMVASLVGDSVSVVERGGTTCVVAVLQAAGETEGAALTAGVSAWAAAGPAGTPAGVASLAPDRVQLDTCDPGADASVSPVATAVDLVIDRQLVRLGAS